MLHLAISPCPNDTFMFHAMTHGLVDTEGLEFDVHFADIEELNRLAISAEPDICKVSYAAVPQMSAHYRILGSGSALGYGNGPLLVSRHRIYPDELSDATVAIPGEHTTANRLLESIYPAIKAKRPYLFSDIATAVMDGEVDAGVLIHEGRFTYADVGLRLVADLGAEWEKMTSLAIPLGAIVVNRRLESELQRRIGRVLRHSVEFAIANPMASRDFVKAHARELADDVIDSHIRLFVNEFSLDIGEGGKEAVRRLLGDVQYEFVDAELI